MEDNLDDILNLCGQKPEGIVGRMPKSHLYSYFFVLAIIGRKKSHYKCLFIHVYSSLRSSERLLRTTNVGYFSTFSGNII